MYCTKCGTKNNDNAKFCSGCGAPVSTEQGQGLSNTVETVSAENTGNQAKVKTWYPKSIAIINMIAGAMLFIFSMESEYDWDLASFVLGIGIGVTGILQLLQKKEKIVGIIQIVFGASSMLMSLELTYDWEYIGFLAGAGLVVVGILRLLNKSDKIKGILSIIFGGIVLMWGLGCFSIHGEIPVCLQVVR